MVCHSLLQWTTFYQTSPSWPTCLGRPHRAWLSFIELDKAVVLVWLDCLVFCEYDVNMSALWCPLTTLTILLGFLFPGTWGISSWLLQQSAATLPYPGWGVSPHCRPSWPWAWRGSSRPSCVHTATAPWMLKGIWSWFFSLYVFKITAVLSLYPRLLDLNSLMRVLSLVVKPKVDPQIIWNVDWSKIIL